MAKAIKIPEGPLMPAIEYCITAGPGRLIDYGVTTDMMMFLNSKQECVHIQDGKHYGTFYIDVNRWVASTTTACETGK